MKILMPQIGMTMQEGTITKWLKADGDKVEKGEPLFEVETEKLTNEIEATESGVLRIKVQAGETVLCGEEIGEFVTK